MTESFGHKFISNFGDEDKGIWFEVLSDLTREQLRYGFFKFMREDEEQRALKNSWPPTLKEFRQYCVRRQDDYQLPPAFKAFAEVENNNNSLTPFWSHPLVYLAQESCHRFNEIEHTGERYKVYSEAYGNLIERFMRGDELTAPERILNFRYLRPVKCFLVRCANGELKIRLSDQEGL